MSKILLYSDWLTTLGGGERYLFALAAALADQNEVVIAAPSLPPLERMADLGFPCSYEMREAQRPDLPEATEAFDLFVHVTTRLPMPSRAGCSYAVVQFPMDKAGRLASWRHPKARLRVGDPRRALGGYQFIVYSEYVRRWLSRRWGVESTVLNPPVLIGTPPPLGELLTAKRAQILSVGRFFGNGEVKRQDLLVEAYKALPTAIRQTCPLVLAGIVAEDAQSLRFVEMLRRSAAGHNISFALDASPEALEQLYRTSSIFWYAAGAGRPASKPQLAEHFGMVTVEAMSRAVVPLVYADGGQEEVVGPEEGVLWQSPDALIEATSSLLSSRMRLERYQANCYRAAGQYGLAAFTQAARDLLLHKSGRRLTAPVKDY